MFSFSFLFGFIVLGGARTCLWAYSYALSRYLPSAMVVVILSYSIASQNSWSPLFCSYAGYTCIALSRLDLYVIL